MIRPRWFRLSQTGNHTRANLFLPLFILLLAGNGGAYADSLADQPEPVIALIIDDLGNQLSGGMRSVDLDGPVACAFLPHAPFTRSLARSAHKRSKEVMLHLPMQSIEHHQLDKGALTLDMTREQLESTLEQDIEAVPYLTGINNHMGSLLTRHPGHMGWLMEAIRQRGDLFFVDSRTTGGTVARRVALENGIPTGNRDVFLDNLRDVDYIREQFRVLVATAMETGAALGIGHPHPETLTVLETEIAKLSDQGLRLVPVSEYIEVRNQRRHLWRASLSRLPTVVKSLKP